MKNVAVQLFLIFLVSINLLLTGMALFRLPPTRFSTKTSRSIPFPARTAGSCAMYGNPPNR